MNTINNGIYNYIFPSSILTKLNEISYNILLIFIYKFFMFITFLYLILVLGIAEIDTDYITQPG
jgi:hypothetical protein